MKTVLGLDPGYGDFKVCFGNSKGIISKLYKFNSVLGRVDVSQHINDTRVYGYKGTTYYVGEMALKLESSRIIDLMSYNNLETFSPLLIEHVINELGEVPDIVVCGLSIAHVDYSGYYRDAILNYLVKEKNLPIKDVRIIPQGVGGKLTYDKYGRTFPALTSEFSDDNNYVGCDIGFNTLDVFHVIQNKVSPNLIRGIESQGVVKIVTRLLDYIKNDYSLEFSVKEGKNILDNGQFKIRGREFDVTKQIEVIKRSYLEEVKELIENEFGAVLDKVEKIKMFGGGSYLFNTMNDSFIETPESRAEYYNSIGNYLHGLTIVEKD
ncbi:MreB-like ATPase protein [Rhizobium phage RHph_TM39]|nr:MreB-like ATPase protein [Rhizobium phage RHph_TM39]QIG77535.1 MreB-like ATPase protein [Rhizobium phage RHph_TM21B]QIG77849.1 MreB-like ATPase protein [Rhizobium phage RHph_TM61]